MSDRRQNRPRKAMGALLVGVVLVVCLLFTDLSLLLMSPLVVESRHPVELGPCGERIDSDSEPCGERRQGEGGRYLPRSDALVVFGGGLSSDGRLGASTEERVRHASELYRRGYADFVVLSGGYRVAPAFEETIEMARVLLRLGVPERRIIMDRRARNTFENARRVYSLCQARGFVQVTLVTSPYHMRRALLCMRRFPLVVRAAPVPDSEIQRSELVARFRAFGLILHEYGGLLSYWWRGWI